MIKFVIPGNPIPKMRHRTSTRGGFARSYDPQSKEKNAVRSTFISKVKQFRNHHDSEIVLKASNLAHSDVFSMDLKFYMPIPLSTPTIKKNLMLWNLISHNKKPDISNLIKFYEDAANEVIFRDDSMIVSITASKIYSTNPRTEIYIMAEKQELENDLCKVLSIYGPSEINSLIRIADELSIAQKTFINKDKHEMAGKIQEMDREIYLKQTSKLLSILAFEHADKLTKVKKSLPKG